MRRRFRTILQDWQPVIALIAVFSMGIGAFSAIAQTNIKRLMAYSFIGHMGYALIGLSAGTSEGVRAVLIYMAIYVIMTVGTFACILMMRRRGGMTENISDLSGLTKTNMPLAIVFTILMFSLAGVPPTAGFFGKWFVFFAAVDQGPYLAGGRRRHRKRHLCFLLPPHCLVHLVRGARAGVRTRCRPRAQRRRMGLGHFDVPVADGVHGAVLPTCGPGRRVVILKRDEIFRPVDPYGF